MVLVWFLGGKRWEKWIQKGLVLAHANFEGGHLHSIGVSGVGECCLVLV